MLIILTSAKTMTGTSKIKAPAGTMPRFAQEAKEIALNMAQFSSDELKKILKLNIPVFARVKSFMKSCWQPKKILFLQTILKSSMRK